MNSTEGGAEYATQGHTDCRLSQAFTLVLDDLYEANAAIQVCRGFVDKNPCLAAESIERQQVWGFIEQAVGWKLALAVERLLQPSERRNQKDRASLAGLIREIEHQRGRGKYIHDEQRLERAKVRFADALNRETVNKLRSSRNAFMGHTLLGKARVGVPLHELAELVGALEMVIDDLHYAAFGSTPPMDEYIERWQMWASDWFERAFPSRE